MSRASRDLRAIGGQDDAASGAVRPSANAGLLGYPPRRGGPGMVLVHAARRGRDDEAAPRARAEPASARGDRVGIAGNAPFGERAAVALAREQEVGVTQPYELIHRDGTTSCENSGHGGGRNGVSLMNYPKGIEQQAADPLSKPYELSHRGRTTSCRTVEQGVGTAQPYELFHGNRTTSCKTGRLRKNVQG